jgi:hypothetical protein
VERDIDYAAIAVKNAIVEKFGRQNDLTGLVVTAGQRTIELRQGELLVANTRDELLALVRKAATYAQVWQGPSVVKAPIASRPE